MNCQTFSQILTCKEEATTTPQFHIHCFYFVLQGNGECDGTGAMPQEQRSHCHRHALFSSPKVPGEHTDQRSHCHCHALLSSPKVPGRGGGNIIKAVKFCVFILSSYTEDFSNRPPLANQYTQRRHCSFGRHFYLTVQNHFLSSNSGLPKGPG